MDTFLGLDYPTLWFLVVGGVFTGYAILDGFDLGAGALHLFFNKETSRRIALNAIGPVWDGNEVWLIAAGGALFFAFPLLYASSFSGFYLPLMIVLWLLMRTNLGWDGRRLVDTDENCLYWRYVWLLWLPIYLMIYWVPRL